MLQSPKRGRLTGLALAAFTTPALAEGSDTQIKVDHVDYAVANAAQAKQLLARLGDAAMEACGASSFSVPQHKQAVRGSACWRASMSDVVSRIGNPVVTAQFERRLPQQAMAGQGDVAGGR
jgi:UrcA family protein